MRFYTDESKAEIIKAVAWINDHDIFWLRDLRRYMGCLDSNSDNHTNVVITHLISELRKYNFCQCSDVSKGERQYIVLKKILIDDLRMGKR